MKVKTLIKKLQTANPNAWAIMADQEPIVAVHVYETDNTVVLTDMTEGKEEGPGIQCDREANPEDYND